MGHPLPVLPTPKTLPACKNAHADFIPAQEAGREAAEPGKNWRELKPRLSRLRQLSLYYSVN
jgi:hypothetical protein